MTDWHEWEIFKLKPKDWPSGLARVRPKIKQLYYRGKWDKDLFSKAVAVVGSRRMTKYGEIITKRLVGGLADRGYTIVSGFMYGVDTLAHKVCLENQGRTVAVLGSGLDCLTPAENDHLYTRILEGGGLVVSEFEPKQAAKLWTFPYRNRIVAGLSQVVLVIEAGEKSGSLVTARWAFVQKKKVLAVPGAVTSELSSGTNWLLRNGAIAVRNLGDVLEELGEERQNEFKDESKTQNLTAAEKEITVLLKTEEMEPDELGRKLGKPIAEINVLLSGLILKGAVEENNGKFMLGLSDAD